MPQDYLTTVRDAVRRDKIDVALQLLQELVSDADELTEIIAQSARYAAIKREIRLGTVNWETASQEKNSIRWAILDFLTELEIGAMDNTRVEAIIQEKSNSPIFHQQAEKIYNISHIDKANFS